MKKYTSIVCSLIYASVFLADAQETIVPSTPFTRGFMRSQDAGAARSDLGVTTSAASATNQNLWTPVLHGGNGTNLFLLGSTNQNGIFSNPTNTGGSYSGGAFSNPTNTGGSYSGGSFSNPTNTGGSYSGGSFSNPTNTGGNYSGGSFSNPTNTGGSYSGGSFSNPTNTGGSYSGGSFSNPTNINGVFTNSSLNGLSMGGALESQIPNFTNASMLIYDQLAVNLQNAQPPQLPPLGFNSYMQWQHGVTYAGMSNVANLLTSSGLKGYGYDLLHIDAGWATNIDANGHLQVDTNNWPGGMGNCVSNLINRGFRVGLWTGGTDQSQYYPYFTGYFNSQSLLDEINWGVTEFYLQWFDNPNLPVRPTTYPASIASGLWAVPVLLLNEYQPIWIFNGSGTVGDPNAGGSIVKEFSLWNAENEAQFQVHDPFDDISKWRNFDFAVANNVFWWIHKSHNYNFGDIPSLKCTYFNGGSANGFEEAAMWLAQAAVTSSSIFIGYTNYLGSPEDFRPLFTNSDVLAVDQDAGMCAPSLGDCTVTWTTNTWLAIGSTNLYATIYKPLGNDSSSTKAVAVMSFSTNNYSTSINGASGCSSWTNAVLNWTNFGYAATEPLLVKDCFYPQFGNWGKGQYSEHRNLAGWPSCYSYSVGSYTNPLVCGGGDLLIVQPVYDLGYHGNIPLVNIAPQEFNNGESAYFLARNTFKGGDIGFPGGGAHNNTNSLSQMVGETNIFYVPGATNFSGTFGIDTTGVGPGYTNNLYTEIWTNGVKAWSGFAGSTNNSYTPSSSGIAVNLPLSGVSNLVFVTYGTNIWGNPNGEFSDYYNRNAWVNPVVSFQ